VVDRKGAGIDYFALVCTNRKENGPETTLVQGCFGVCGTRLNDRLLTSLADLLLQGSERLHGHDYAGQSAHFLAPFGSYMQTSTCWACAGCFEHVRPPGALCRTVQGCRRCVARAVRTLVNLRSLSRARGCCGRIGAVQVGRSERQFFAFLSPRWGVSARSRVS